MTMGAVDLRDVDWVLTNRITEWHREHYLCSTTRRTGYNDLSDWRETHERCHADGGNAAPTTPRVGEMVCGYRPDLVYYPGHLIFRESLIVFSLHNMRRTRDLDFLLSTASPPSSVFQGKSNGARSNRHRARNFFMIRYALASSAKRNSVRYGRRQSRDRPHMVPGRPTRDVAGPQAGAIGARRVNSR